MIVRIVIRLDLLEHPSKKGSKLTPTIETEVHAMLTLEK